MFNKKESGSSYREGFDTLIGVNTTFEGNIVSEGSVRIDGKVKGDLNAKGDVIIGKDAHVTGNVVAGSVNLSGIIEGNISCAGILKILTTAKLYGDIEVNSFIADEGALFQGRCNMIDNPLPEPVSEKPAVKKASRDYKKSTVIDQEFDEKENV